jgi:hypothetical protein
MRPPENKGAVKVTKEKYKSQQELKLATASLEEEKQSENFDGWYIGFGIPWK